LIAVALELSARVADPAPATLRSREPLGQLVAAAVAELRVLGCVDLIGLGEDLARERVEALGRKPRGIGRELGAVDGQLLRRDQPGLRAELEDLAEQIAERDLVTLAEPSDRRVIRRLVGGDDAKGDVLDTALLDAPRGPLSDRSSWRWAARAASASPPTS
jgi:hypothetical protein